jgi:ubiquinone/menaquinone biosynthesis C-methylase UbiE
MSALEQDPEIHNIQQFFDCASTDQVSSEQYETSLNHLFRLELLKGLPSVDHEIMKALNLQGNEICVDIGCGDGTFIKRLAIEGKHIGPLIGVNSSEDHYFPIRQELANMGNVLFLQGDARELQKLGFEDEMADVVTEKFLLYHLDNPERAVDEACRILKPGGSLVIASRNPGYQGRLWEFLEDITVELKRMTRAGESKPAFDEADRQIGFTDYSATTPPQNFYKNFDLGRAESEMQARGLNITHRYMQSTKEDGLKITLPLETESIDEAWITYQSVMTTFITAFGGQKPRPSDLLKATDRIVKPIFYDEIARKGYFEEHVEQGFIIAQKPQRS